MVCQVNNTITPIILSQNLDPAEETKCSGIHHGILHSDKISVHVPNEGKSPTIKQISLPKKEFLLSDLGSSDQSGWKLVIMWLKHEIGQNPFIMIDHDHPLRELMLFSKAWSGLQYGLRFATPISGVHALEYALLGNASVNLFLSSGLENKFREKYIGPYRAVKSLTELLEVLIEIAAPPAVQSTPIEGNPFPTRPENGEDRKRLLIVSYFSGPCRAVGVQRINYWFDQIAEHSDEKIETHLATAIDWAEENKKLHIVPDQNIANLLGDDSDIPAWSRQFIATEQKNAKSFNTLSHYWRYALEQYFKEKEDLHFDVVLITGNPFSVFDFAAFVKRRWRARVILDYRDPFANNPRMRYKPEQRKWARYIERGYNFQSDAVLVVNSECVELVEAKEDTNTFVVLNGYDERITNVIQRESLTDGVINFVYAGAFDNDRSPRFILSSMNPESHRFHFVGNLHGLEKDLLDYEVLVKHGIRSYQSSLAIAGGADCGVVLLSKSGFETPTKIFDYLAMGIDILICTQGEPKSGALHELLGDRGGIYWCQNTEASVAEFINAYRPSQVGNNRSIERFSRRHSTNILIEKINELTMSCRNSDQI